MTISLDRDQIIQYQVVYDGKGQGIYGTLDAAKRDAAVRMDELLAIGMEP